MILSIINQKGGVGKTITSAHLAACFSQDGPVLLIDLDAQGSLSNYFEIETPSSTMYDVLVRSQPLDEAAITVRPNIQLVPSTLLMSEADARLPHVSGGDLRLSKTLRNRKETIILDCPSGWGAVVRNAALAATHVLIPINSESAALETAIATEGQIRELCEGYERPTPQISVLLTFYRETRIARSVAYLTATRWQSAAFSTRIRRVERINELTARRATVLDVSEFAGGSARSDYQELAKEIGEKWQ